MLTTEHQRPCSCCTYLNLPEARSVTGGHVLVESLDGGNAGHLTVLLVHVVRAGARVVAQPDAEVLGLQRLGLGDLRGGMSAAREMRWRSGPGPQLSPMLCPSHRTLSFVLPAWPLMLLQRPPQSLLARSPQLLTALQATISPVAFFIFRSWRTKYQKRLLATVALGAKMRMR